MSHSNTSVLEDDNTGQTPEAPFFSARLMPYRSLSRRGFLIFMATTAMISFAAGLAFLSIGAWPIFGFFGLDVALISIAFRLNYRSARVFEELHVSAHDVHLFKVGIKGERLTYHFNPAWVQLEATEIENEGVVRLGLRSHGLKVDVGNFLHTPERTQFAKALRQALALAKRGRPQQELSP